MSDEGASENFRVFCRTAAYDVIFFFSNSRGGGGQVPPPLAPAPAGAHGYVTFKQLTIVHWEHRKL